MIKRSLGHSSQLICAAGVNRDKAKELHQRLESRVRQPISLRVNNNNSTLISIVRPRDGSPLRFSVHWMFMDAPDEVKDALAQYIVRDNPANHAILRHYMDHWSGPEIETSSKRLLNLRSRGAVYDLHKLAEEVNQEFFNGEVKINISWSRGATEPRNGRSRRHIIFGSYDARHSLVRIHPALDSADVPEFFVKFVIYHEMLHHVLDTKPQPGGRRCVHTPQFRDRERRHPHFKQSLEWERKFMQGRHK